MLQDATLWTGTGTNKTLIGRAEEFLTIYLLFCNAENFSHGDILFCGFSITEIINNVEVMKIDGDESG